MIPDLVVYGEQEGAGNSMKTRCNNALKSLFWSGIIFGCVYVLSGCQQSITSPQNTSPNASGNSVLCVRIVATSAEVETFTGTKNVRIVFTSGLVNAAYNLYTVDFSNDTLGIHKLSGTTGGHFPVLSPDGNWIAYQMGNEGQENAAIWVDAFDGKSAPQQVVTDSANTPLFTKETVNQGLLYSKAWYVGDGSAGGSTVLLPFNQGQVGAGQTISLGSYHGGLSRGGLFLATTCFAPNPLLYNVQIKKEYRLHSLLCKNIQTGSDTIMNLQTCNCSVSSSFVFPDCMMYLDFGLPNQFSHSNLGTWGFHKRIFIADTTCNILKYYDFPDSLFPVSRKNISGCCWTHCKWAVNHPYFAISGNITSRSFNFSNGTYSGTTLCEDIYLIDLRSGTYLKLVESVNNSIDSDVNLQWPSLWVDMPNAFTEDAAWLANSIPAK
jgi:hypothetical protein